MMLWLLLIPAVLGAIWLGAAVALLRWRRYDGFWFPVWLHWLDHSPPFTHVVSHKRTAAVRHDNEAHYSQTPGARRYLMDGGWLEVVGRPPNMASYYMASVGWKARIARAEYRLMLAIGDGLVATTDLLWDGWYLLRGRRLV